MKKYITMAVCLLLATGLHTICKAQSVPVPEFQHKIMGVNPNNTLVPLEKTRMVMKDNATKGLRGIGNMYAGKAKVYYSAEGCCSQVHRSGKTAEKYIVSIPKVNPNIENPDYGIELYAFEEVKKGERRFHYGDNFSVTDGSLYRDVVHKKKQKQDYSIELVFKKQSDGVYIITTKDPLPPGEYIFIDLKNPELTKGNFSDRANDNHYMTGFCFNVQ